jgi:hypothetical protein
VAYIGVAAVGLAFPLLWFRRSWHKALQATALVLILTYPTDTRRNADDRTVPEYLRFRPE